MGIKQTRKLVMKFKTSTGDDLNVILNYAKEGLENVPGSEAVAEAMDELMSQQIFTETLASKNGAQVITTTTTDVEFE